MCLMKIIVQIPCLNEEETLPQTIHDIPRDIEGVDRVEILVLDDGSTDRTADVARELGVDHVISNSKTQGLARTFRKGIDACLHLGADIIVNTDGDNQYRGQDIPRLIAPLIAKKADIVVGDRQTNTVPHFSWRKKLFQRFGSWVVRYLSGLDIPDAVSGFRAISRDAAIRLNIISPFSYTIEMLIQAGKKHMAVASVPIGTNPKTRESRLFKAAPEFIERSLSTMIRMYAMYQPLRVFFLIGSVITLIGIFPIIRFLYFYFTEGGFGHLQSLVLGGVLVIIGFITLVIGLVADLISFNRQLIEMTLERVRSLELSQAQAVRGTSESDVQEEVHAKRQE